MLKIVSFQQYVIEFKKQQQAQLKELKKRERMEKCTNRGATTTPKVLTILADIVFWISSVFILLSVIVGFTTEVEH